MAAAVEGEQADERTRRAREELDDDTARRQARLKRELDDLRSTLATSQERVGYHISGEMGRRILLLQWMV